MYDELERLRGVTELRALLAHYAELAGPDRQVWQDRRMPIEGGEARALSRLHGELLAYGDLEQNTGVVPAVRKGETPGCYRVTRQGLRALEQASERAED